MALNRYNVAYTISFDFVIRFYAADSADADSQASAFINKIFGPSIASLIDLTSISSVALAGQDITGANYTYTYNFDFPVGDAAASPATYAVISAETAALALAQIQNAAKKVTGQNIMPLKVTHLLEI